MRNGKADQIMISLQVKDIAAPICEAEGFEFVHAECVTDRGHTLVRIYADKPGGITIDDCVSLNRLLGDVLDVQLEELSSYRLEVSSPGPNRPLTKPADFDRFKGRMVRVETFQPMEGRKRFKGRLEGIENDRVRVSVDQHRFEIPCDQIEKARLA